MLIPPIAAPPPSTAPPIKLARLDADRVSTVPEPLKNGTGSDRASEDGDRPDLMGSDRDRSAANAPSLSAQSSSLAPTTSSMKGTPKAAESIAISKATPDTGAQPESAAKTESLTALLGSSDAQANVPRTVLTQAVEAYTTLQGYKGEQARTLESV